MIIGITGHIGSGKTTLANFLHEKGFVEVSFADAIKQIGLILGFSHDEMYGTQEQKLSINSDYQISGRQFLQKFGTDIGRNLVADITGMKFKYNIWIDVCMKKCRELLSKGENVVISDIRFVDEAKAVKELGGIIIALSREGESHSTHESELEIGKIKADYTFSNLGKEQLFTKVDELLRSNILLVDEMNSIFIFLSCVNWYSGTIMPLVSLYHVMLRVCNILEKYNCRNTYYNICEKEFLAYPFLRENSIFDDLSVFNQRLQSTILDNNQKNWLLIRKFMYILQRRFWQVEIQQLTHQYYTPIFGFGKDVYDTEVARLIRLKDCLYQDIFKNNLTKFSE